jgi:hypothetical protein
LVVAGYLGSLGVMPPIARTRPKIGDVIEIPTSAGFAYAHYTHKYSDPPNYGALLRVLPDIFAERPKDFAALVNQPPQFLMFYPLGPACARHFVRIVASESIPPHAQEFPTFRSGTPNRNGVVENWWLWNGRERWHVGALTPGMEKLPIPGVWNHTLLVERIVAHWRQENSLNA